VAVEAALITPVLVLLIFGIIEFAFVMRDYGVVSSDVRAGGRIASTGAGLGPGTCDTSYVGAPPCTPAKSPALAQLAADAIQREGSAMPANQINYILVYKANAQGYPGADGNKTMPSSCSGFSNCVRFTWQQKANAGAGAFRYTDGAWTSSTISACFPGTGTYTLDRVGVYMNATHKMMTGLFGSSITISDHAVFDFEPLPSASCNGTGSTNTGGHS
jgi:hypothetical protein